MKENGYSFAENELTNIINQFGRRVTDRNIAAGI